MEYATIWKMLGVAATKDKRVIKRAYAAKLKSTKPDENPAEFQQLHQCYKQALKLAESIKQKTPNSNFSDTKIIESHCFAPQSPEHDNDSWHRELGNSEVEELIPPPIEPPQSYYSLLGEALAEEELVQNESDEAAQIDEIYQSIDRLFEQYYLRQSVDKWREVIASWAILDENHRFCIGRYIFEKTSEHNLNCNTPKLMRHKLPQAVLAYLDKQFLWQENEEELRRWVKSAAQCNLIFDNLMPIEKIPRNKHRNAKHQRKKRQALGELSPIRAYIKKNLRLFIPMLISALLMMLFESFKNYR